MNYLIVSLYILYEILEILYMNYFEFLCNSLKFNIYVTLYMSHQYLIKSIKYKNKNQLGGFAIEQCKPDIGLKFVMQENEYVFGNSRISISKKQDGSDIILGRGSFGEVIKGKITTDNINFSDVAIKKIINVSDANAISICNELQILNRMNLSCVPKYYGYYHENNLLYIFTEFIDGINIQQFIYESNTYIRIRLMQIVYNLIKALSELHTNNIIHRDIKPANIIITSDNNVKYIDFGLSCILNETCINSYKFVGSLFFVDPQLYYNRNRDTDKLEHLDLNKLKSTDMWSLGCTIFYILTNGKSIMRYPPTPETGKLEITERNNIAYFAQFQHFPLLQKIYQNIYNTDLYNINDLLHMKIFIHFVIYFLLNQNAEMRSLDILLEIYELCKMQTFISYFNKELVIHFITPTYIYKITDGLDIKNVSEIIKQIKIQDTLRSKNKLYLTEELQSIELNTNEVDSNEIKLIYQHRAIGIKSLSDILLNTKRGIIKMPMEILLLNFSEYLIFEIKELHTKCNISGLTFLGFDDIMSLNSKLKFRINVFEKCVLDTTKCDDDCKQIFDLLLNLFANENIIKLNKSGQFEIYKNIGETITSQIIYVLNNLLENNLVVHTQMPSNYTYTNVIIMYTLPPE
jgi:serine/threonine protein kinase